jgi:hypothetical protein
MATWQKLPGLAKDIAVDSSGIAWVIGTNPVPGGFSIYRWVAAMNDWEPVSGGAVRIGCGRVSPIVVNDVHDIYRYEGTPPGWVQLPGKAMDVAAEEDVEGRFDNMCAIGTNPSVGGFGIYWWDLAISDWRPIPGGGVGISGGHGLYVVNDQDEIYSGGIPPTWQKMPGAGKDIGVNLNNVWVIGTIPVPGGYGIYRWNAAIANWEPVPGGAVRVACGRDGTPWVVNDGGEIFRRVP